MPKDFKIYITNNQGNLGIWDETLNGWFEGSRILWEEYRSDSDMRMLIPLKALIASLKGLDMFWNWQQCILRDNQFDSIVTHLQTKEMIALVVVDEFTSPAIQHFFLHECCRKAVLKLFDGNFGNLWKPYQLGGLKAVSQRDRADQAGKEGDKRDKGKAKGRTSIPTRINASANSRYPYKKRHWILADGYKTFPTVYLAIFD